MFTFWYLYLGGLLTEQIFSKDFEHSKLHKYLGMDILSIQ